jgi:hypothetical protein
MGNRGSPERAPIDSPSMLSAFGIGFRVTSPATIADPALTALADRTPTLNAAR